VPFGDARNRFGGFWHEGLSTALSCLTVDFTSTDLHTRTVNLTATVQRAGDAGHIRHHNN
jgi:hypothetical protein